MDSTRIELTPEMVSNLATPHINYAVATSFWDNPTLAGAGAIQSTANDMLKFLAANLGMTETELQPALQLANSPQRPTDGLNSIGLGWGLPNAGKWIHEHDGGTGGTYSYVAWDPKRKIGVVMLTNAATNLYDVVPQLLRGLPKSFPVDPQILAAYAGKYQTSEGVTATIRVDGGRIFLQALDQPEAELLALSDNQFYPRAYDAEFTFYKNDSGEVDRMVAVVLGETLEAKKVP
jgi:CubicO group peptidase (beta-lactamase class C family)